VEELLGIMLRPPGAVSARLASEVSREERPRSVVRALETLWDRGGVRFDRGVWDVSPASARAPAAAGPAWTDRLRELDGPEASLVALAALLSAPFDEEFAAKFLEGLREASPRRARGRPGRPETGAARPPMARLRSLARRGFLVEDAAGFRTAEGFDPDALAGRFEPEALRGFHERIAQILLERYGSVLEGHALAIAEHFRLGGNAARALELFLVGARYARGIFANRRSIDAYHRALEVCADAALKAQIAEELGEVHVRVGEYPVALQCFALSEKLSELPGAGGESGARARDLELLDKVGRVLHRQGELGEALAIFSRAFERSAEKTPERARALFRMGSIHLDRGDSATARRYLQESLDLYRELGDRRQVVAALSGLGLAEKYEDRLDRAAAHFEEALRNAEASGCLPDIATALNNLANVLRALGDDERAIECLRRSIDVRRHVGDRQGLAISLNNIARVHAFRGEIREAIAATETALSVFEEIGDRKGVLIARSNLGELAHVRSEFAKALENFLENLSLAEKLRHERLWVTNLLAIAELELDRGNYEEALARARRALASAEDGPKELRARALGTVAAASAAAGNLEAASDALRDAFEAASEIDVREQTGVLGALRIRLSLERGEAEKALASAREILARLEKRSDRYTAARVHREVGRLYRELGPDWADLTEKHLGAALRSFDAMGSRHQSALTRAELAVYWRLVGEEGEASRLFRSAAEDLAALGLARRVAELQTMRDVS
ncbi:MAG: tetratricopeptide repeat protein, partial [Planctomycetota bacterium]